jgi:rhodanese-related sulfurtransferase
MSGGAYAGDASPEEAWEVLSSEPGAALIDVRTAAEWTFVGVPDLSGIAAPFVRAEWQTYPSMQVDPEFTTRLEEALAAAGSRPDSALFFLCRSGARSAAAARAMTAAGYSRCFNVAGGFEGMRDDAGHRGTVEGWKAANLPWVQA